MKEIGIEKLIRYLLESKGEEYKEEYYEWYRDVELEQNIDSLSELKPFIGWLVENDKIDRDEIIIKSDFMPIAFDRKGEKYEWSEEKQLLMLLSISSSPIDDLISYLK